MTPEETVAFVQSLYATTGAGDWDAAAAMLTDDFIAIEADGLPMAGEYHGTNGLKDLYTVVMGNVDIAGLEVSEITVAGDCAIAVVTMEFADPSIGKAEICEMFRFRDGKCCQIKPYYFDPAPFIAAFEAKKAAA